MAHLSRSQSRPYSCTSESAVAIKSRLTIKHPRLVCIRRSRGPFHCGTAQLVLLQAERQGEPFYLSDVVD